MAFTYAGQYGPFETLGPTSLLLKNTVANVYLPGTTTPATLYTDRTKGTAAANPTATDSKGNLTFFADPGRYDVAINGSTVTVAVPMDPAEISDISTSVQTVSVTAPLTNVGTATNPNISVPVGTFVQQVAAPTGVAATDTAAIQAAINAAAGAGVASAVTRTPTAAVRLQAGTYVVNADLLIQSEMGFHFQGAGKELTFLKATGTGFTTAVLNVDGSAYGTFEDFTIIGDGTEQVTNAIAQQWTVGAFRSTTQNTWRNINVRNIKCVNGFNATGHNQNDGTLMIGVDVSGGQVAGSWSAVGNWQAGYLFGDGTNGNNLDHWLIGCSATNWYRGVRVNASSVVYEAGEPASNGCEFMVGSPVSTCSFRGIESEQSGQLLDCSSSATPFPFVIEDFRFDCSKLQANAHWYDTASGTTGPIAIKRGYVWNPAAGVTPIFYTNGQSNPTQYEFEDVVIVAGVVTPSLATAIAYGYGQGLERIQARNLTLQGSGGALKRYARWANFANQPQPTPPAVPASTVALANPYDIPVIVYVVGGTVTVIAVNGNTTGATTGPIALQPGDTITLTYSVAPTWNWLGAP